MSSAATADPPEPATTGQKISVSVDGRTLRALDAFTASGSYPSRSAVIKAGVRLLELDAKARSIIATLDALTDEDRADNHELAEAGVEEWAAEVPWQE